MFFNSVILLTIQGCRNTCPDARSSRKYYCIAYDRALAVVRSALLLHKEYCYGAAEQLSIKTMQTGLYVATTATRSSTKERRVFG